jgi:glyoxylase-like metal-dependent hydrolase (beta-lactamase superfamily II)
MGSVNCYLLQNDIGYYLIDTGMSVGRKNILQWLETAGCRPGNLRLILITHGDFDHTGNAAFLRKQFGVKIAMHQADAGMVEHGDMFENRKQPNIFVRLLVPLFTGFGKAERFTTDLPVEDGYSMLDHGFDGRVVSLPGHSRGSIGLLTSESDLFCGDLFENTKMPLLNSLMDDADSGKASMERLNGMNIRTVYPGHGGSFLYNVLL